MKTNLDSCRFSLTRQIVLSLPGFLALAATAPAAAPSFEEALREVIGDRDAAFVLIECATGAVTDWNPAASRERLPPCSTFKIWNALLGIEAGLLTEADQDFHKWDGIERDIPSWNRNLDLRDAFQASCVPAFQALARQLGEERMRHWVEALGYGDGNITAGVDLFWLPAKGRNPILISPREQAALLCRLSRRELPCKPESVRLLLELMRCRATKNTTLYGKTGSGTLADGKTRIGWFVGLVAAGGRDFAFAMRLKGAEASGAGARELTEDILARLGETFN